MSTTWLDTQDQDKVQAAIVKMRDEANREHTPAWSAIRYSGGDERFALWLLLVDQRLLRRFGLSMWDLADWMSRDAYDGGMSPAEGAREALEGDDIGAEMLAEMEG